MTSPNAPTSHIRVLCYCAIFAAITAVLAQISIPLPGGVPLTLQTLAVMLSGIILGARKGTFSVVIYILLGSIGLPVYAGLKGGLSSLLGPTGGFIMSFWLISLCSGTGFFLGRRAMMNLKKKALLYIFTLLGIFAGVALNYLAGIMWFALVTGNTAATSVRLCLLPFMLTDTLKILLAAFLGPALHRSLTKSGLILHQ